MSDLICDVISHRTWSRDIGKVNAQNSDEGATVLCIISLVRYFNLTKKNNLLNRLHYYITLKSQDYGDVSARNTTRAPNNMQKLKLEKLEKVLMYALLYSGRGLLFSGHPAIIA